MPLQPYVFFDGRCDEAIELYKSALGAEVKMLMRFGEAPAGQQQMPQPKDRVMHARLEIGGSVMLASDGQCGGSPTFQGFGLTLTTHDIEDAKRKFGALTEGGQVRMPLDKTFFSPCFGMVVDRFGVLWMIYVGD